MKYLIRGYIHYSNQVLESQADNLEQAQRYAGFMLELNNCYKVEIIKVE